MPLFVHLNWRKRNNVELKHLVHFSFEGSISNTNAQMQWFAIRLKEAMYPSTGVILLPLGSFVFIQKPFGLCSRNISADRKLFVIIGGNYKRVLETKCFQLLL